MPSIEDLQYCQWSYYGSTYHWDCAGKYSLLGPFLDDISGAVCEAFADGQCVYGIANGSETDCYGETEYYSTTIYQYCCTSDNCNYVNITTDSCTRSTPYENYWTQYYQCEDKSRTQGSAYETYVCDQTHYEVTCDALLAIFTQTASCWCKSYNLLYDYLSGTTRDATQTYVDNTMKDYSKWNEVIGCDIDLVCDISTGLVTNGGLDDITTTITDDDENDDKGDDENDDGNGGLNDITTTMSDDDENDSAAAGKVYFIALLWPIIVYFVHYYY